jgi:catechol 2,3-dioxygenase-like lactoylglutathione lyase family enzyme
MSTINFNCVYLIVQNIELSADFYCNLLQTKIDKRFEDRWIQIKADNGFTIGLLSTDYDAKKIKKSKDVTAHYDDSFIANLQEHYQVGDAMVINLSSTDLQMDYQRISSMKPSPTHISPIQYVNFMFPYHFFTVKDPDGHVIEIADN